MHVLEKAVSDMYSTHPFPRRNQYGVNVMNQDFAKNLEDLGLGMGFLKGKKVLDAGCGTGELALFMARSGAIVDGVDISDGSLKYARECAAKEGLKNITFTKKSLIDGKFPENTYDVIVSHMVLHHTSDAEKAFKNIVKSLKSGGTVIIRLFFLWGRLSPFQKSPLWKLWVVKLLAGKSPDAKVKLAEKLFYKEGDEKSHGLDKYTYLYDNYGVPQVTHHTYGQLLRWFRESGIDYFSSNPPVELKKMIDRFVYNKRQSVTARGRFFKKLADITLTVIPLHKAKAAEKQGLYSRFFSQFICLFLAATPMFTICGTRRK